MDTNSNMAQSPGRVVALGEGRSLTVLEGDSYVDASNGQCLTGAWLWDASIVMAKWFTTQTWPPGSVVGKRVVELGAGTSLPGMTLAKLGASVILTDRKPLLAGIKANIKANQLEGNARACELHWGLHPDQLKEVLKSFQDLEHQQQQEQQQQLQQEQQQQQEQQEQQQLLPLSNLGTSQQEKLYPGNSVVAMSNAKKVMLPASSPSSQSASEHLGVSRRQDAAGVSPGCATGRPLEEVDLVIGSDIMYDPDSETMVDLSLSIKSLSGPGTRIFLCCELRPPLPRCFQHLYENGLRWTAVPQDQLHPDWASDDIKIFEISLAQADTKEA